MFPFERRLRWWIHGEQTPLLRELLADPDAVLASARSVAREQGGRKRFYRLRGDGDARALFVKVYGLESAGARLRYLLRPSKARLEREVARRIRERGFAVAEAVAVGEERVAGVLLRSLAVIPELPSIDLRTLLLAAASGGAAARAARVVRALDAPAARGGHRPGRHRTEQLPGRCRAAASR